ARSIAAAGRVNERMSVLLLWFFSSSADCRVRQPIEWQPDRAGRMSRSLMRMVSASWVSLRLAAGAGDVPTQPANVSRAVARPTSDPVAIQGRAVEYRTRAGLANARVAFGRIDFSGRFAATFETTTDAGGSYTLKIPADSYLVMVGGTYAGTLNV